MRDFNYIAKEIAKRKNLESNLSRYASDMAALYHELAYLKLSMNYYTVYEMEQEQTDAEPKYQELLKTFHALVKAVLDNRENQKDIQALRQSVAKVVEVVTAYVDCLRIYEYVLNRIEHRFSGESLDEEYYNTYFTNDLMHYILSDEDQTLIHGRISEVVEQLPMRLSRAKFYERLRDTFTLYYGAQQGTVEDFAYMLKTTAMLHRPDGFDELFPELNHLIVQLFEVDYSGIDQKEYEALSEAVQDGAVRMANCADAFILLEELVNDLYTVALTKTAEGERSRETAAAREITAVVCGAFCEGTPMDDDEIYQLFVSFEGKQEKMIMMLEEADYMIHQVNTDYAKEAEQYGVSKQYYDLEIVGKLQSGSNFAALEENADSNLVADDAYVEQVCETLIDAFKAAFKQYKQPVRRAMMSAVLARLPVFFQNTQEIQQYINMSLMQCSDEAEQIAVVEILRMIMSEDDGYLQETL